MNNTFTLYNDTSWQVHLLSIQTNGKIPQKPPKKRKTFPSNFYQFNYRIEIGGQLDIAYQVRLNINSN